MLFLGGLRAPRQRRAVAEEGEMAETFDVAVIGASLAGASLALRLGRKGVSVALIDKELFPRKKACGEGLSALGLVYLRELHLLNQVLRRPHCEFFSFVVYRGTSSVQVTAYPSGSRLGIGIERSYLDTVLVGAAAAEKTVKTYLGAAVRHLNERESGFTLAVGDEEIMSRYLVLADGAKSFFAAKLGFQGRGSASDRYGYSAILESPIPHKLQSVCIFSEAGFEVYCTPVCETRLNISVLGGKKAMSALREPVRRSAVLQAACAKLGFEGQIVGALLAAGPLGRAQKQAYRGRVLLIGDSCQSLDPIGGLGMTHALMSAALAADALSAALQAEKLAAAQFAKYDKRRRSLARQLNGFTRLVSFALGSTLGLTLLQLAAYVKLPQQVLAALHSARVERRGALMRFLLRVCGHEAWP